MKPQASAFLDKSRALLDQADTMLESVRMTRPAARRIWPDCMRRKPSIRDDGPRLQKTLDRAARVWTAGEGRAARRRRTYNLKAIADYETGPDSHVSEKSAREAIQTARRFVECVTSLIPPNGQTR
jgi:hypothetical protein